MTAVAVDIGYLAASYSVTESTLHTLLDAPTVDLVRALLEHIEAKARETDEIKAEKLRTDVELENTIRGGEARTRALKTSVDKGLQDVEELRKKLNESETARTELESELHTLKSASSSSTSEVQILQSRIATLEAANRDAAAALDAKSTAHDRLAEEISTQHQKILSLRREVSQLEEKNQTLDNASMSAKFREQGFQQKIELLQKNLDWHESELKTRSAEHAKFRKDKGARISELQRLNEDANQTIESLRRTETTLRQRVDDLGRKADDSLIKIQQLQEAASKQQESFRVELDSAQRLADLQKQSAETAKARLQEVQAQLDQANDNAAEEVGLLQAEVETERSRREAAENRIAELELQVEKLEAQVSELENNVNRASHAVLPGTPRRALNGYGTPGRAGSPAVFSPGASRSRGGLTVTQLYSENTELKSEVESLRRRNESLTNAMDEMLQDLEQKQPEIDELRTEHERLANEVGELSALLEETTAEKDQSRKESRKLSGENQGLNRQCEILQQQLRDTSAQIKLLLVESQVRAQGMESLNQEQQEYYERVIRGEMAEEEISGMSDTSRLISQRLVLYRNIEELQNQNTEILRTIREVADKFEGTEAKAKAHQMERDQAELGQLREKLAQAEDEIQSLTVRSKSFVKERDMFRRMLMHRGQLPPGADAASMFGQSIDERAMETPPPGSLVNTVEQTPRSKEVADYSKLIKELEAHFDAYRQESATDHAALKQQVDKLARDKGDLQADNARISSQLTLAHERYELLQSNLSMLKSENQELQKRSQSLQEIAARQDLRTQQVAEDLIEAKGLADSMRNDNANLKAERELWKKIEARISDDNRQLMDERTRLNKMITDLQNLQNERELSESENRRRLQSRIESLETELQTVKRKLDDEQEDNKKINSRREFEQEQSRSRVEELLKSLKNTNEELLVAKTLRDQLEARVAEMKIELRNAEERATAIQQAANARSGTNNQTDETDNGEGVDRDTELAIEISNLKRDLELARADVEAARSQVEQYKSIAQGCEEELQNMNDTHDQYREEMDQIIAEKDSRITELERRLEEISTEMDTTNRELSDVRRAHEESSANFNQQKEILESEVTRLKDECQRYQETARLHQEDLKAQSAIAQQAQQSYETELVKHGEATKSLRDVREQYNKLKSEVAEYKSQSDAARTTLSQSEDHWNETRERYERELAELRARNNDIKSQNAILHQQLENVSSQIAGLKQTRLSVAAGVQEDTSTSAGLESLQEVIRYLRQEKEIVDVQYELSIQEAKRLKQQLDLTQSQLDQTREKLDAERQSHADREQNASSYSKLRETIDELNLYRESATTLRNEARQAQTQLSEKSKEVENLLSQIQPLQTRVREVENELETKHGEFELLQQDRDRWQKRTQDILQKYDRIDPAELEALKTRIETLQTERDEIEKRVLAEKTSALAEKDKELEVEHKRRKEGWVNQHKNIVKQLRQEVEELKRQLQAPNPELEETKSARADALRQVRAFQKELDQTKDARDEARSQLEAVRQELEETKLARDEALANINSGDALMTDALTEQSAAITSEEREALEARITAAEHKANEETNRALTVHLRAEDLQGRIDELENQSGELRQRIASLEAELAQAQQAVNLAQARNLVLQSRHQAQATQAAKAENVSAAPSIRPETPAAQSSESEAVEEGELPSDDELESLKEQLNAAQKEIEYLRVAANLTDSIPDAVPDDTKPFGDQVKEQVANIKAELDARFAERVQNEEQRYSIRATKMKNALNKKLASNKETIRGELQTQVDKQIALQKSEHEDEIKRIKIEHEAEIQRIKSEHEAEVQRLKAEHDQEVQRLKSEHDEEIQRLKSEAQAETVRPKLEALSDISGTEQTGAPSVAASDTTFKSVLSLMSELSEKEVKDLVAKNEVLKDMVARNVRDSYNKRKDAVIADIKKEQEKITADKLQELEKATAEKLEAQEKAMAEKLQEQENVFNEKLKQQETQLKEIALRQKESAVALANKRADLKQNMVDGKLAKAKHKFDLLETAAKETPDEPYAEVWTAINQAWPLDLTPLGARNGKAATVSNAPATAPAEASEAKATLESTSPNGSVAPTENSETPAAIDNQPVPTMAAAPSPQVKQDQPQAPPAPQQSPVAEVPKATSDEASTNEASQEQTSSQLNSNPFGQQSAFGQPSNLNSQQHLGMGNRPGPMGMGGFGFPPTQGLPQPGFIAGNNMNQGRFGQGLQPQIPRPQQGNVGGHTGIPQFGTRGRGQNNGGRQNQQGINIQGAGSNQNQNQGGRGGNRGGRGRGGFNPNAAQFTPAGGDGKKRARDDGGDGEGGGHQGGKRARSHGDGGGQ